jgi:glycosyltransferase involved in cell wall biosynthesis
MVAVRELTGSGGAERQFTDVFEYFGRTRPGQVALITAHTSVARLRAAGRLRTTDGVISLPLGSQPAQGRLGVAWTTLALLWATLGQQFDVVHVCLPTPSYVPYTALMRCVPRKLRPRVALNVIDCTLAPNLTTGSTPADLYERQVLDAHRMYFRWSRLDGVYSWYESFVTVARAKALVPRDMVVQAARFCFTDPQRFRPAPLKEQLMVFAGRLSEQKRPILFVDAVAALRRRHPQLAAGWRFEMYGHGVLGDRVADRITELGLRDVIALTHAIDMAPVFARSRVFVSTQAFENFTSLAMLEAMASGNAIIAENVGQTSEFVRHQENGLLVSPPTPEAFADALADYLRRPERHEAMAAASRAIATDVHTIEHFAEDITAFWRAVLDRDAA